MPITSLTVPGDIFQGREGGVPILPALGSGGTLLSFAHLSFVDDKVLLIFLPVYRDGAEF